MEDQLDVPKPVSILAADFAGLSLLQTLKVMLLPSQPITMSLPICYLPLPTARWLWKAPSTPMETTPYQAYKLEHIHWPPSTYTDHVSNCHPLNMPSHTQPSYIWWCPIAIP
jgi:hypothetical protein